MSVGRGGKNVFKRKMLVQIPGFMSGSVESATHLR